MTCPFLDSADSRCAQRLSLNNLKQAFQYCFGRHHACPLHTQLLAERVIERQQSSHLPVLPAAVLKAG
ncbi:MAG: hypothetical protein BIFFINMI_03937 [Phycisphaerae bacterium]|nr:hypothetical protein [Phycisphaerae bacterium]